MGQFIELAQLLLKGSKGSKNDANDASPVEFGTIPSLSFSDHDNGFKADDDAEPSLTENSKLKTSDENDKSGKTVNGREPTLEENLQATLARATASRGGSEYQNSDSNSNSKARARAKAKGDAAAKRKNRIPLSDADPERAYVMVSCVKCHLSTTMTIFVHQFEDICHISMH